MKKLIFQVAFTLVSFASLAQPTVVDPRDFPQETDPKQSNFEFYSRKNGTNVKASFDNVRKNMLPKVRQPNEVAYTPSGTGNSQDRGFFVRTVGGAVYFIDGNGAAMQLNGLSITAGGGIVLSGTPPDVTISAVDKDSTNELQTLTIAGSGPYSLLLSKGGGAVPIVAGTGMQVSKVSNTLVLSTTNTGTVTSVGLSAPASEFDVSGSPVNGNGTINLTWDNQTAGKALMSPAASTGQPLFRKMVASDIPLLTPSKITGFKEATQDSVASMLVAGPGIIGSYNDGANTYTISAKDTSATNELQSLSVLGNVLTISGGNSVSLSALQDNWGTQGAETDATLAGNGTTGAPLKIAQQGASNGQALVWNGTTWAPGSGVGGLSIVGGAGISVTGTPPNITVTNTGDTNGGDDITTSTAAGGDLSGTYPNPTVAKIQTVSVSASAPSSGQVLKYNGTAWAPGTDNSGTGTVTSVGLTAPSELTVTGSPITGSGTIALAWATQTAAKFLASPNASSGTPGFRTLIWADVSDGVESVQDIVGAMAVAGSGVSVTYNDPAGTLTVANTSPDQTVAITNGGGVAVTGTYPNFTLTATDQSVSNEGSLSVGAGTSTTSLIQSNTSGSPSVTLQAGSNITLSESGNVITIAASGGGSSWLLGGNTLGAANTIGSNDAFNVGVETNGVTRLWVASTGEVTVGATALTTYALNINGLRNGGGLFMDGGSGMVGTTFVSKRGSGSGSTIYTEDAQLSVISGNVLHYIANTATTGSGNAVLSINVDAAVTGNPYLSFNAGASTWSIGLDNDQADRLQITPNGTLGNVTTGVTILTDGKFGSNVTPTLNGEFAGVLGLGVPNGTTGQRPSLSGEATTLRANDTYGAFEIGDRYKGLWYPVFSSSAPASVTAGAAAGTGPTVSIVAGSNDVAGAVDITVGSSPTTGVLCTVTFTQAYGQAPKVRASPGNGNATGTRVWSNTSTTTTFTLDAAAALVAGTTYRYNYDVRAW